MTQPRRTDLQRPALSVSSPVVDETNEGEDSPAEPRPFPTVHIMRGEAPEPPGVHVKDLVLDRDINLWTGHGGSAKSVTLLHVCVCVATGLPVFGSLEVSRPGPVLLVLPEDGQANVRMILDAIVAGMELGDVAQEPLAERLVMVSDEVIVNVTTDASRLRDTALHHKAVMVVIDPLRNVLGTMAENDNDVAGAASAMLRHEICRNADATLILAHHNRKPGKDAVADSAPSAHDARGAAAWINAARLAFAVTKRDSRVTLAAVKSNRLRADLRHELELTIESNEENRAHWTRCRLDDANRGAPLESTAGFSSALTPGIGRPVNANERKALEAIDNAHEPGKRMSWSGWLAESGLAANTLKTVKKRLLEAGLAQTHDAGEHRNGGRRYDYSITDRGRKAIENWMAL